MVRWHKPPCSERSGRMLESYVMESADYAKIKKLRTLHNMETFWDGVRKFTKNVKSDHSLGRWQILAEARYGELMQAKRSFCED